MRYFFLTGWLTACSGLLFAQTQPDNLVHFPYHVAIGPTVYTANAPAGYNLAEASQQTDV